MSSPSVSYMMISEIKLVTCVSSTCINNVTMKLKYGCYYINSYCLVFHQGDEGTSWYIIYKGSVNVIVHGKVYKL